MAKKPTQKENTFAHHLAHVECPLCPYEVAIDYGPGMDVENPWTAWNVVRELIGEHVYGEHRATIPMQGIIQAPRLKRNQALTQRHSSCILR